MNKKWILLAAFASCFLIGHLKAGVVYFGPSVSFTAQQPVRAVFVDAYGNTVEKTCYFNPELGGVDIGDASYTSVYFPDNNVRYMYANGFWIGEDGYYWNGGRRYYYDHPGWRDHWHGYWGGHTNVYINEHNNWHDGGHWHGGHEGGYWHGGGHRR
jgi:hypothetical protein